MKTIEFNQVNELIINKSRFITYLYRIDNENAINLILEELKAKYSDATHHCYAYIVGNVKRFNDDNEPSKTAGMPMLNVLESNCLDQVLAVTIRYFGGIKLGAGGLVRAYTKSVTECLKKTNILEFEYGYKLDIIFSYDERKTMENILNNYQIVSKNYQDNITYTITCNELEFNTLKENNYNLVSLGSLVFRMETACIYMASILNYEINKSR